MITCLVSLLNDTVELEPYLRSSRCTVMIGCNDLLIDIHLFGSSWLS